MRNGPRLAEWARFCVLVLVSVPACGRVGYDDYIPSGDAALPPGQHGPDARAKHDAPPARHDAKAMGDAKRDAKDDAASAKDAALPHDARADGDARAARDAGDAASSASSVSTSAVVAGGVQASSPHYRLVITTGQSPGGNGTMSSPSYQLRGGTVGATQGH